MRFLLRVVVIGISVVAVTGCGSKYDVVPVSGTIFFNGEPLSGATILTQPVGKAAENNKTGPGSFGKTDEDGKFSLELQNEPTPGAVPGECVILITEKGHADDPTSDVITRDDLRSRIPDEYRTGKKTITIPEAGTDTLEIVIETKKKRR